MSRQDMMGLECTQQDLQRSLDEVMGLCAINALLEDLRDGSPEVEGFRDACTQFVTDLFSDKTPHQPHCTFEHEVCNTCTCIKSSMQALLTNLRQDP